MRTGDFRGLVNARTRAAHRPERSAERRQSSATSFPRQLLSQQALTFLAFEPQPNTSNGTFNFATTPSSATSTQRNFLGRIDHTFSSKDPISGRYLFNDTYEAGIPVWGHDERNNLGRTQNVAASWTHTFSPTLINEFRGGWHHFGEAEVFGTTNDASLRRGRQDESAARLAAARRVRTAFHPHQRPGWRLQRVRSAAPDRPAHPLELHLRSLPIPSPGSTAATSSSSAPRSTVAA